MAQILETSLLNHLNYPTLIATKASRISEAGRGRPILEFGLRRAQERGANAGARAATAYGRAQARRPQDLEGVVQARGDALLEDPFPARQEDYPSRNFRPV